MNLKRIRNKTMILVKNNEFKNSYIGNGFTFHIHLHWTRELRNCLKTRKIYALHYANIFKKYIKYGEEESN